MEEGPGDDKDEEYGLDDMCASGRDAGPHTRTTASQDLGERLHAACGHPGASTDSAKEKPRPTREGQAGLGVSMGLGRLELPTARLSGLRFNHRQEASYLSNHPIQGNPEQPANLLTATLSSLLGLNGKHDCKRVFLQRNHLQSR